MLDSGWRDTRNNGMTIWKTICPVLLLFTSLGAWAQESDTESSNDSQTNRTEPESNESTDETSDAENRTEKTESADETKTSEDTPDVFDPTEEISEDYAVPFPVDI